MSILEEQEHLAPFSEIKQKQTLVLTRSSNSNPAYRRFSNHFSGAPALGNILEEYMSQRLCMISHLQHMKHELSCPMCRGETPRDPRLTYSRKTWADSLLSHSLEKKSRRELLLWDFSKPTGAKSPA